MTYPHVRAAVTAGLLVLGASSTSTAQWTVSAGVRSPRFSGGAVEPGTDRSLLPYRPTIVEVGVEHVGGRFGGELRLHYASSSLALEGDEAVAAIKDALTVYGITPSISLPISHLGPAGLLRVSAGPLVEVWKYPDIGSHWRVGVTASIALEVPFGGHWAGSARLGGAVSPSPFAAEDLEPPLEPRRLWRREAAASLQYRL
jgi:hypothetical protein